MLEFKAMTTRHVPDVVAIERATFPNPWNELMFYSELVDPDVCRYFVAIEKDRIVGYIGMQAIPPDGHITNFNVHPEFRLRGYGTRLLAYLIKDAQILGVKNLTLEVRVSNIGARRLYSSFGFTEQAIRKRYYIDNKEDAIILRAEDIDSRHFRDRVEELLAKSQ